MKPAMKKSAQKLSFKTKAPAKKLLLANGSSCYASHADFTANSKGADVYRMWIRAYYADGTQADAEFFAGSRNNYVVLAVSANQTATLAYYFNTKGLTGQFEIWASVDLQHPTEVHSVRYPF